jgi:hypothetical protein
MLTGGRIMVAWYWIPISLLIGVLFGVLLTALCVINGDDE